MGYTKNAISGFGWQTILKIASALVILGKMYVLARLLSPQVFGLFSLATIALGLAEAATQTGVNVTLISSHKKIEYFLDSAWFISIIRGFLIGSLMIGAGMMMSSYFANQDLMYLVGLLSLVPVIKGFINPYIVSLQKELKFGFDTLYRFSLVAVEALVAVGFGLITQSAFALAMGLVISAIFEVTVSFLFLRSKPKLRYSPGSLTEILSHMPQLSLNAIFSYLSENLDNLLIGKLAGVSLLGIYHNGYALSHRANFEFSKSIGHSTLPIYARLKNDEKRLTRAYKRSLFSGLLLMTALSLPLLFFPQLIVDIVLGPNWNEVTPILRYLVLAGLIHGLANISYAYLLGREKYSSINIHLSFSLVLMVILIYSFYQKWGFVGASAGLFYSRLLSLPLIFFLVTKKEKL